MECTANDSRIFCTKLEEAQLMKYEINESMTMEKLIRKRVAGDHAPWEWQQTLELLAAWYVAKKIILVQARVREKLNARQAFHNVLPSNSA